MTSKQYEELCRFFLADQLGVAVEGIASVLIPNATRPNLPSYKHQIDLYWETGDALCHYLNIANARWRGSSKVDQPDVLLLEQVKNDLNAHKAVMITSSGFTSGAEAVAQHKGIALHIVRPDFDFSGLPLQDATAIQQQLTTIAASSPQSIYSNEVVHRAFDLGALEFTVIRPSAPGPAPMYSPAPVQGYVTRVMPPPPNRMIGGGGPGVYRGGFPGSMNRGGGPGFGTK
ncbi:MAG TPA: restriction endonuclease [Isosphaeraceae bacterium]|nr:restriction endonuclease [Isosphaeraceae bacterium]